MEIFKPIERYENLYMVSSYGRVKSLSKKDKRGNTQSERILSIPRHTKYYNMVSLVDKDGKVKTASVHRLVALAFLENPLNLECVNHKDGNKLNNDISNLEWISIADNTRHAHKTRLNPSKKGENNPKSKLTEKQVIELRHLYSTKKYKTKFLSEKFNLKNIHDIINYKTWSHIN
jgi:hypothetical protein